MPNDVAGSHELVRDALDGAGSPRLVLVREPDQLGVAPVVKSPDDSVLAR